MDASPRPVSSVTHYLEQQEAKSLLRFLTCGSVDDGKSRLFGGLIFDTTLKFQHHQGAL